jgi:hypothetical protein
MLDIDAEVAALQQMTTGEVRTRYAEVFREEPRSRHKAYLIRKIAWRLQANAEGDLSERARRRAEELADDAEVRTTPPRNACVRPADRMPGPPAKVPLPIDLRLPAPGTAITRNYKGRTLEIRILQDGFEYDGQRFKTLSAVAKTITGSHCNGFRFFNLGNG